MRRVLLAGVAYVPLAWPVREKPYRRPASTAPVPDAVELHVAVGTGRVGPNGLVAADSVHRSVPLCSSK